MVEELTVIGGLMDVNWLALLVGCLVGLVGAALIIAVFWFTEGD